MPHRRSRKKINGVPDVKLSSNHVCVSPATADLIPSVAAVPDANDPDATFPDVTFSSTNALVDLSCSCYVDYAPSVSTINDHACSSLCVANGVDSTLSFGASDALVVLPWASPDMNPVFDCFDQLDSMLANLSFKVAFDLAPSNNSTSLSTTSSSGHAITVDSTSSQDVLFKCCRIHDLLPRSSLCDASSVHLGALGALAFEPSLDCLRIQELLAKFLQCYWLFEVHCLDEIDVVSYYADSSSWSLELIKSCLVEYEILFEHFSKSSVPRILEVHCPHVTQV